MAHIVLIEHEPATVDFIDRGLTARGFEVRAALDGDSGLRRALGQHVDLVVLDLMLPRRRGIELLSRLAKHRPRLPVIALTANAEIEDRVAGLNAGAADCLVKPFTLTELEARIRAHLLAARQAPVTTLRIGSIEVDLLTRSVRTHRQTVRLTNTEFDLLVCLMQHAGQVLSRPQLLRAVWHYQHNPTTNIVDVYVSYLRRKLSREGRPVAIKTVRGHGYRFEATEDLPSTASFGDESRSTDHTSPQRLVGSDTPRAGVAIPAMTVPSPNWSGPLMGYDLCLPGPIRELASGIAVLASPQALAAMSHVELEHWTRTCSAMAARPGRASSAYRAWCQLLNDARAEHAARRVTHQADRAAMTATIHDRSTARLGGENPSPPGDPRRARP